MRGERTDTFQTEGDISLNKKRGGGEIYSPTSYRLADVKIWEVGTREEGEGYLSRLNKTVR